MFEASCIAELVNDEEALLSHCYFTAIKYFSKVLKI